MARLRVNQNLGEESFLAIHSKKANAFPQNFHQHVAHGESKVQKTRYPVEVGLGDDTYFLDGHRLETLMLQRLPWKCSGGPTTSQQWYII